MRHTFGIVVFVTALTALTAIAACGGASEPGGVAKFDGTATIGGKPVKITGCKVEALKEPNRPATVFTFEGGLRYRDDAYEGMRISRGGGAWEKLDCENIKSHTEGAGAWAKGEAGATCKTPDGELVFSVTFECGVPPAGGMKSNRKE